MGSNDSVELRNETFFGERALTREQGGGRITSASSFLVMSYGSVLQTTLDDMDVLCVGTCHEAIMMKSSAMQVVARRTPT